MRELKLVLSLLTASALVADPSVASAQHESPPQAPPASEAPEGGAPPGPEPATPTIDDHMASLRSPDPAGRIAAVRGLGDRRVSGAVPQLRDMLRSDPVPEVRGWVVRALHSIGTPEAHQAVVTAATEDPDERVRSMAARLEGVTPAPASPPSPREGFDAPPPPSQPPSYAAPSVPQVEVTQRQRIPGRGLRLAGIITTASSYGLALIVGLALITAGDEDEWGGTRNFVDWGWKMMLPIVGPAVAATTNDADETSVIFWIWSAAQAVGVTLLAIGYARRARHLRENPEGEEMTSGRRGRFGIALLPTPGGLSLSGTF